MGRATHSRSLDGRGFPNIFRLQHRLRRSARAWIIQQIPPQQLQVRDLKRPLSKQNNRCFQQRRRHNLRGKHVHIPSGWSGDIFNFGPFSHRARSRSCQCGEKRTGPCFPHLPWGHPQTPRSCFLERHIFCDVTSESNLFVPT